MWFRRVLGVGALVVGAAAVAKGLEFGAASVLAGRLTTGDPNLDRDAIRGRVAAYALSTFGPRALTDLSLGRALMAIVHNESGGNPANYVGDANLPGGPSIGPMNVYRKTAKELGLWLPPMGASEQEERDAYLQLAGDEDLGIKWGVAVFANKLRAAGGDVADAVRRYNGSGSDAISYREKALAFATQTYGGLA